MLRRNQLCPGPADCPDVLMRDPFANPNSPACDECPIVLLDEYLTTPPGRMIGQTLELDSAMQAGVTISLKDITYPEFLLLRFLGEERSRFQQEEMQRASERHGR
jgi:hypothetical protein